MHPAGFRLAVSPGGCSGLAAEISVRREPAAGEAVVERDGVKLFLPAESRILLDGVTIDFADTPSQTGTRVQGSEAGFLLEPLEQGGADDGGCGSSEPQSVTDAAVLANALLGGGLPPEAEFHLWEAGLSYHLDDVAEHHLREAQALAPGHAAVLIGLYRFYFYKGRLADALTVAKLCLEKAARENKLAADWQHVVRASASPAVPQPRRRSPRGGWPRGREEVSPSSCPAPRRRPRPRHCQGPRRRRSAVRHTACWLPGRTRPRCSRRRRRA